MSKTRTQPVTKARVDAMSPSDSGPGDPSLTCSSPGLRVQVRAAAVTNTPWSVPAAAPMMASQTWYLMALSKSKKRRRGVALFFVCFLFVKRFLKEIWRAVGERTRGRSKRTREKRKEGREKRADRGERGMREEEVEREGEGERERETTGARKKRKKKEPVLSHLSVVTSPLLTGKNTMP